MGIEVLTAGYDAPIGTNGVKAETMVQPQEASVFTGLQGTGIDAQAVTLPDASALDGILTPEGMEQTNDIFSNIFGTDIDFKSMLLGGFFMFIMNYLLQQILGQQPQEEVPEEEAPEEVPEEEAPEEVPEEEAPEEVPEEEAPAETEEPDAPGSDPDEVPEEEAPEDEQGSNGGIVININGDGDVTININQ